MAKKIEFPDIEPRWIFNRDCIAFLALVNARPVRCIISMEALLQGYGAKDASEKECLRAFRENRRAIEKEAIARIKAGAGTNEQEVVIRVPLVWSTANRLLHFLPSSEIENQPELTARLQEITLNYVGPFAALGCDSRVHWEFAGTPDDQLFQMTMEDAETEGSTVDWFSNDQLNDPAYLRRRFDFLWSEYLRARSKKQLEKLRAVPEAS